MVAKTIPGLLLKINPNLNQMEVDLPYFVIFTLTDKANYFFFPGLLCQEPVAASSPDQSSIVDFRPEG